MSAPTLDPVSPRPVVRLGLAWLHHRYDVVCPACPGGVVDVARTIPEGNDLARAHLADVHTLGGVL